MPKVLRIVSAFGHGVKGLVRRGWAARRLGASGGQGCWTAWRREPLLGIRRSRHRRSRRPNASAVPRGTHDCQLMATRLPADVASFLADFPPPIRAIATDLRAVILSEVPHATERVRRGWRSLNYHDEGAGFFAAIFPYDDHAGVVFERGAALKDPDGL